MADGSAIKGSEDAMQRCNELESELAELRAAYEQYFMGNERFPPLKKHEGFKKQFMKLKSTFVRQTATKFRIESIGQKMLTFERLWERTIKEIEAGTYKRHLFRLKRHGGPEQQKKKKDSDFDVDEDLDISDLDDGDDTLSAALAAAEAAASTRAAAPQIKPVVPAITPLTPPAGVAPTIPAHTPPAGVAPTIAAHTPPHGLKPLTPPIPGAPIAPPRPSGPPKISAPLATGVTAALKPAPAVAPPARPVGATGANAAFKPASSPPSRPAGPVGAEGGLSDTKVKAIYDAYVMAKKRCGEDTRAVTLDSVASSLRKQVPELMKQHNAKSVEFKVVIKDGKAVLRALPKD